MTEIGAPLSRFVGRSAELAELQAMLREHRLVTLLGTGGIGKTRLALEVAAAWREIVEDVLVVDFGSLHTGDLVDGALLEAAGIGPQSGRAALDATIDHLARRSALVVLDTCEHVLASAAQMAERLLRNCPEVRVLTTSRTLLDLPGEVAWPVPPLRTDGTGIDGVSAPSDAVSLFVECATRARPSFRLDDRTFDDVARIVRGVDGIPLAIELAAARLRVLTAGEIASGLSDHLRLLGGGPTSAARHHTMRASLDWSYALLDPHLARLLGQLSIFAGGWTLAAAEAVCADDDLPATAMLDAIAGLVDRSLVQADSDSVTTRYRMLDFVRQYAQERLLDDPVAGPVALRHRQFFRDLAERADRELWAVRPDGRARLDAEAPNLRQAVAHANADGGPDALRLVGALALYWRERGRLDEGIRSIEQALAATPMTASAPRALALAVLSTLTFWRGDFARTASAASEAISMAETVGDARAHSHALGRLGSMVMLSDPGTGDHMLQRAAELARQTSDDIALCDALTCLALSYHFQDDRVSMTQLADQAMAVAEARGYDNDVRWCLWCSAHGALAAGEIDQARALGERAHGLLTGQDPFGHMCAVEVLSLVDALTGHPAAARQRAEAELERSMQETVRLGFGALIHALAVAALAADDLASARNWADKLYAQEEQGAGYLAWHAQDVLMRVALAEGDPAAIRAHSELISDIAQRLGNRRALAIARTGLARAVMLEGDLPRAESLAQDALAVLIEQHWRVEAIAAIEVIAAVAASTNRPELAARLFAAAHQGRQALGVVAGTTAAWSAYVASARDSLGAERYDSAAEQGSSLSLEEAAAYARRGRGPHRRGRRGVSGLSPLEEQVARLAASGLTNVQIAAQLFISRSTVKMHLSHVYAKLGVANRTELARVSSAWPGTS